MKKFLLKNKFLIFSVIILAVYSFIDISITFNALENTWNQILSMLMIVPPIFILIGLFDVWVPREKVIELMGEKSGVKGMVLAFLLGAFSAGPTIAAFPLAMIMIKKGAKYSNIMFFLMVWSSLKIPIVFYQITAIGLELSMIINITMVVVFIVGALVTDKIMTNDEQKQLLESATKYLEK